MIESRPYRTGLPRRHVPSETAVPRTLPVTRTLTPPLAFWMSGKRLWDPGEPALLVPEIRKRGAVST